MGLAGILDREVDGVDEVEVAETGTNNEPEKKEKELTR
jgi:hypothetical protein